MAIQPSKETMLKQPFLFPGTAQPAANSQSQLSFSIPSAWAFRLTAFTFVATNTVANTISTFDIQILDQDKTLFYDWAPSDAFCGVYLNKSAVPWTRVNPNAQSNWFTFDASYLFQARSQILVNLRDTSGQANKIQIILKGAKVIKGGSEGL